MIQPQHGDMHRMVVYTDLENPAAEPRIGKLVGWSPREIFICFNDAPDAERFPRGRKGIEWVNGTAGLR